ncbi:TonB-dependent receptor [Winogradskyella sediminis]|uniref:Outer membrane protein beta-barrel family protein n=1 Tax=Winogradskyella sediminis TaxID=1382466 RepID=A0A1H1R3Y7_9FLAO|nr:carboxypeptidase-like regulatory domain-containing protein [Winogradskyella sediminis]SDS30514.1 Outer membrane protein beta-barrel family protein [Winogradskyella sediminis]
MTFGLPILIIAQQIKVQGKVTDSIQNPLAYANILAIPETDDIEVRFAITDNDGGYKLGLFKNQTYELTVSYIGYKPQKLTITTTDQDLTKNFILKENPNQLDEVNIKYTPPITVKKDTITYDVTKFVTGEERKLRDALKKLPGVEVDREGNVTVRGKKVTKVLVESKTFFTGNSKLAVNNIPADAVEKVEVLDNYNEVAMLKGLQDSEDMAMNILLKEDKKKFVFGDIEAGGGIEERYLLHPNIFYYSPKTNVNFIGDLNNQGIKSFSFQDYLEFEGGFSKLLDDASSYFSLFNSDFTQYLNNQDYTDNINQFGALNIRQSVSNVTDISGYLITSNSKTQTASNTLNAYQNIEDPFTEDRTVTNNLNNFFTIGKVTVDYKPSYNEDFAYNAFVKVTNNDSHGFVNTINPDQNNSITTLTDVTALNLKQNITYSRKLSIAHTATLEATYYFQNDKPITEWLTNQQVLQGLIPLEDADVYTILQTKKSTSHNFNAIIKDYWVINNFNHLYTSVGINTSFNDFYNEDVQLLSDGRINNFSSAGFGNDFGYSFIDSYLGLEYKFQIGIATFKPAVFYHGYLWRTQQFDDTETFSKNLLLPQFTTKVEFNNSEKLNFKYKLNARFPGINQLANNFVLSNFNSVYKGNNQLENQLYHSATLSYYKFSLFKNLNLNFNTSFNKRIESIKTVSELNGIESFNTAIMFDQPEHNWMLSGRVSKKINKIRYNLSSRFSYNDNFQILNNETNINISKSISSTIGIETSFKNYPNIEINYTKDFNNYKALNNTSKFENDQLEVILEYDFLNDFIFKADYTFDNYSNKSQATQTTFDTANASLFYQKEDSPWGFEVNATNLVDVKFKQQNSFNAFVISDSRTFILPRIVMFKVSYKL